MKKIIGILALLLIVFGFNFTVKAEDTCSKEELSRLKELAKKVEINYDYVLKEVTQDGIVIKYPEYFSLTATNLNDDLKVMIIENYYEGKYKEFKNGTVSEATLKPFNEGEKVTVTIKAFVPNKCSGKTILSKVVKIPYYNRYYDEGVCANYPDFKYCSEIVESTISAEQYERELGKYISAQENIKEEVKISEGNWNLLITIGAILVSILIIVLITWIIVKVRKKNSL